MKARELASLLLQHPELDVALDDPDLMLRGHAADKVMTAITRDNKPCLVIATRSYLPRNPPNLKYYGDELQLTPVDSTPRHKLWPHEVRWIVNSKGELGVQVYGQCFWLNNGVSIEYDLDGLVYRDQPLMYRKVLRNEFGRYDFRVRSYDYLVPADYTPVDWSKRALDKNTC